MCIEIEKEGIFNSIQGLGDFCHQKFGINPRGAMDQAAVRIINILLGNPHDLPALELHFPAGSVRFTERSIFALGGATYSAELDDKPVDNWRTYEADPDQTLRFKARSSGNRCYLAVNGGLIYRSTDRGSSTLEITTKRLLKGDRLSRKRDLAISELHGGRRASSTITPAYSQFPTVRFLQSGEFNRLDERSQRVLSTGIFDILPDSNRMGFRLNGPRLMLSKPVELVSSAVNFGTMQLLPGGQIIVLMADHQTTGGYPRIGNIISTDLPLIGQLAAGDKVAFALTSIDDAERAFLDFEADLRRLEIGVSFRRFH